jgi:hypothetical protein
VGTTSWSIAAAALQAVVNVFTVVRQDPRATARRRPCR